MDNADADKERIYRIEKQHKGYRITKGKKSRDKRRKNDRRV